MAWEKQMRIDERIKLFNDEVKEYLALEFVSTNPYNYTKKAIASFSINDVSCIYYPSIKDAAKAVAEDSGKDYEDIARNIAKCLQGKRRTAYGYIWQTITDY